MVDTAMHWGAEALWRRLKPLLPGLSVEVVARIQSTNSALLERARAVPEPLADDDSVLVRRSVESSAFGRRSIDLQPCLLVAEHQTGGRGRQGRPWQSAAGASLTFSLALPLAVVDWSGLSLAVGVALCEALAPEPTAGVHLALKWPNDVWLMDGPAHAPVDAPVDGRLDGPSRGAPGGRKLGGVLIETVATGAADAASPRLGASSPAPSGFAAHDGGPTQRLVVVGVGLNVLPFDAGDVRTGFASLHEIDAEATAPSVLARVMPPLVEALRQFEREGFAAFCDRFDALDLLRGRRVRTTHADVPEGIARGVSAQGALWVEAANGERVAVSSGEVSVRLGGDPGAA